MDISDNKFSESDQVIESLVTLFSVNTKIERKTTLETSEEQTTLETSEEQTTRETSEDV